MSGLITFRLGRQEYATPLVDVREVVRLEGLADLPGMVPPLAGVLDLRGTALPVLDLRLGRGRSQGGSTDGAAGVEERRGDVLVLERGRADGSHGLVDGSTVGVAVDQVRAVVDASELPPAGGAVDPGVLPSYVVEVLSGTAGVVFLVDLARMVDSARATAAAATA